MPDIIMADVVGGLPGGLTKSAYGTFTMEEDSHSVTLELGFGEKAKILVISLVGAWLSNSNNTSKAIIIVVNENTAGVDHVVWEYRASSQMAAARATTEVYSADYNTVTITIGSQVFANQYDHGDGLEDCSYEWYAFA